MGGHKDNFVFFKILQHMIPFWKPWDPRSPKKWVLGFLVIIRMSKKVKNKKNMYFNNFECFNEVFNLVTL